MSTPAQKAVADMFVTAKLPYTCPNDGKQYNNYFEYLLSLYQKKMDTLISGVTESGLIPIKPEGSFFLMCDTSNIQMPKEYESLTDESLHGAQAVTKDWAFCR